jgi:formylglycine-generating enzyme required for sulfatase activity
VDLPSLQRLRDDADQAGLNDVKFAAQCLLIEQELRAEKHGPTLQRALEALQGAAVGARDTEDLLCVMLLTIWHELSGEPSDWTKIEARMARVQATFDAWQAQPLLCKRLFDIVQPMVAARRTTPARTLRPGKAAKPYSLLSPLITGKGLLRQLTGKDGMKLCLVPSGLYPTYSPEGEKQALAIWVYPFYIDEHPVTFAQYRRFCQETGHDLPPVDEHLGHNDPRYLDAPVTNISPEDARAYAQWAGRLLPVAQEWSAAAAGPEGRRFPWGETLDRVEFPGNANATPFCFPEFAPGITVDVPAFFALLQGSLSLTVTKKAKVINAIPTLFQFQVDELIKVFEGEKEKFVELVKGYPDDVQNLQKRAVINWNVITSQRLRTHANRNVCQVQNDQAVCGARDFVGLVREWIDPGANRDKDYAIGLPYIPGKPDETEAMTRQHTGIVKASRAEVGFRCVLPLMERDLLPEAVKTVLDRWRPDI